MKKTGAKIARISGLEPARPYFYEVAMKQALTPDDAEFVDVIHTNSGPLLDVSSSIFRNMVLIGNEGSVFLFRHISADYPHLARV